jgi:DNA-binding transcriptional LysR family regulator
MELRHLRYFIAAAEYENVSRAALELHLSQPALSRQIHDLEGELGVALFERSAKSVRLTATGRVFLDEAKAVLARAQEAIVTARKASQKPGSDLHIGYAPSPTARILPTVLRALQDAALGIRAKLHDLSTGEMLAGLRDGSLQVAFLVKPSRAMMRGLHFEELARERMHVAAAPGHPYTRLKSVTPKELVEQSLLVFSRKDYPEYHEYLERMFHRTKGRPRMIEEHDGAASLIAAIESGAGVAILPESFACTAGNRLKLIPIKPPGEPIIIGAAWVEGQLTPAGETLLRMARETITNV